MLVRFAGGQATLAVTVKSRVDAGTAWQVVQQAEQRRDLPLLLIAETTTGEARRILAEHGVSVVDGHGNAHLQIPGLLFHTEGRKRPHARSQPPARLRGKAGIVAQALLMDPKRTWQVKQVAETAGVATALAHRVLTRLEDTGVLVAEGSGPNRVRRVVNPTALLDLWTEEAKDRYDRTLAYVLAQTPDRLIKTIGERLAAGKIAYALTGAAAASLVAPFVTALPIVEVWVQATKSPEQLLEALGADPVTSGQNIVMLRAQDDSPMMFSEKVAGVEVVNRFRLYFDLRSDPKRGVEQANHLRREVIGF